MMAKPDLDDGWFKFAYELLPAILLAGFRVEAAIVLCEVFAQTYGRGKSAAAKIEPAKVAARSGRRRENIWRGLKELTDAGVLVRRPDGLYRFVKDYTKWHKGEGTVFDNALASYCAAYPSLAKRYELSEATTVSTVDTAPEQKDPSVSQVDTELVSADASTVSQVDTPTVSTVDTLTVSHVDTVSGVPPITPLVGGRVGEGRDFPPTPRRGASGGGPVATETKILPASPGPMPGGTYDPSLCPPYPVDGQILMIAPGAHEIPDATAREVYAKLWQAFGNPKLCQDWFEAQREHAADRWLGAIRALWKAKVTPYSFSLIRNKANELSAPKAKANPAPRASPAERPVPPHREHVAAPDSKFHKVSREAYEGKREP